MSTTAPTPAGRPARALSLNIPAGVTCELELRARDRKAGMTLAEMDHFVTQCRAAGFTGSPRVFVGMRAQVTRMVATVTGREG